jgi:cell wall-associated NlpC family hydrolase
MTCHDDSQQSAAARPARRSRNAVCPRLRRGLMSVKLALIGGAVAFFLLLGAIVGVALYGALFSALTAAVVAAAKPGLNSAMVPRQYLTWVIRAGNECSAVSPPQIAAQIQQESAWQPDVVSNKGAEGIAQFLPATFAKYGQRDAPGPVTPTNAADAIMAMGRYDCVIARRVAGVPGSPLSNMLAGYNAGPDAVLASGGVPPFAETQLYVAAIEALIPKFEATTPAVAASFARAGSFAQAEIDAAEWYLGTPYVWGGGDINGPTDGGVFGQVLGFDCSGLVQYAVYQASGRTITLPRTSELQATVGTAVPRSQLAPGDVIAIQLRPDDYSHIVIYIGGGQVIQAPETGQDVDIVPLNNPYFSGKPQTIRWYGP